ncbi:MAG: integrase arm-type DNA-binding domain-containing protein [Methylocella sp.]
MPVLKLTKRSIDALAPTNKTYLARDADLKGFACRVTPAGAKAWCVAYRPRPGGRGVREKVTTLGGVTQLTPDQARQAAADMLEVRLGADPAAERNDRRKALTVADLIDAFTGEHVATKVKERTAEAHAVALTRLREAHGALKTEALIRAHLATLHSKMRDRPSAANRALAVWGKLYSWAGARGLVPEGHNPARAGSNVTASKGANAS